MLSMDIEKSSRSRRAFRVFYFFLVVVGFFYPVGDVIGMDTQPIKIFGYVKDMNDNPLANSFIGVANDSSQYLGGSGTDYQGYYQFYVDNQGVYNLSAQHSSEIDPYVFDYVILSKTVEIINVYEKRVDFNLSPAGNIILHFYNDQGDLVRYGDLMTMTNNQAYVTNMDNLPNHSVFRPVHDDYSIANPDTSWGLQIPACIVIPQTQNKIHAQWEVKGFGEVMVSIDNEGKGYTVSTRGEKLILNFNYEAAKSKIAALQRDYDLLKIKGYNISLSISDELDRSKQHLEKAEQYLSCSSSSHMRTAVEELSQALKHSFSAHENLLLEKAKTDIEIYRKGNVRLKVLDSGGNPVPYCNIFCNQITHDFLFAANPMGYSNQFDPRYANLLKDAGINYSYIIAIWNIEKKPSVFDWYVIDVMQNIQSQLDQGFKLMGSLALWFMRSTWGGDIFCPYYQDEMTYEELKGNIYNHMYQFASRYKDKIDIWEINEQNMSWTNELNLTWNEKIGTYRAFINGVKEANPLAKVIFTSTALPYEFNVSKLENPDSVASGTSFPEFLDFAISEGIVVDNIGLEFYYSGVNTDGYIPPGLDLVSVSNLLDQYSEFGIPIFARELSAPSTQIPDTSWWHRSWDETTQAEYLEKFYTIAFSKPLVREIGWSFGVSDKDAFIISGGLMDDDLNLKPSYYTLKNLIDSWMTVSTGKTDERGEFELRGFGGNYNIQVDFPDGAKTHIIHLYEQKNSSYQVTPNAIIVDTTLGIKANNSDNSISVPSGIPVSISIDLNPSNNQFGQNADWWLLELTPAGFINYFDLNALSMVQGFLPTYQGPLFNFGTTKILDIPDLTIGTHDFYFGVDTNMNGAIDAGCLYYDYISVDVLDN